MLPTLQVKNEITADPKALGYGAVAGNYIATAAKMNATYAGVGTVFRSDVTAAEVLACLVWSEVALLTTNNWLALHALLIPGVIDATKTTVRNIFAGLFPSATFPGTFAALSAVAKQPSPTRAEELWGYGTRVSEQDVANAITG